MTSDIADLLRTLGEGLTRAQDVEDGATVLLSTLRQIIEAPFDGGVLGGMVHLRSEDGGYRALVRSGFEASDVALVAPSATVWRCVLQSGAVAIDLGTQKGVALASRAPIELASPYLAPVSAASVQQMLARETSHVIALPLVLGARPPIGMASIELAWPEGVGRPFPDGDWMRDATLVTDFASARLAALPPAPTPPLEPREDALLPVLGAKTRQLVSVLRVFVEQDETILISGPTGAGKSRLAEWCHRRSRRASAPFETANLLAVPESMQMAELFGWKKGAFTGAHADHEGLVACANGGTLFLDEIDKLSLAAQAGLLRVLETRRFAPLGAARERVVDVRFIVATNADLSALVRRGSFREDLYYRVNVLPVRLPPLAERTDEVGPWARWMLARRSTDASFSPSALGVLQAQSWPGNLRQLDNVVRRVFALHLAEQGGAPGPVGIDVVMRALSLEGGPAAAVPPQGTTYEGLLRIADRLVDHAVEARRLGHTLSLDELDVLRGAILRAAVERVGSVKDAYLLFGADALVRGRNHTAAYRRDVGALETLERLLERSGS